MQRFVTRVHGVLTLTAGTIYRRWRWLFSFASETWWVAVCADHHLSRGALPGAATISKGAATHGTR